MEGQDAAGERSEEPLRFERRRVKPEDMKPDAALAALATQQEVSVQRITLEERGRRRVANEVEEEMERHDRAGQRGEEPPRFERRRVKPEDMKPDAALAALATQQEVSAQRITLEERGRRRVANEVRARQDAFPSDNIVGNQARTSHSDIEEEPRNRDQERDKGGLR